MTESFVSSQELGRAEGDSSVRSESLFDPANTKPRRIPLSVPREQLYYWSREWQGGESEADEELRRGEARSFDNAEDALRWLDEPED